MKYTMTDYEQNGIKDFETTFSNIKKGEKFLVKDTSSCISSVREVEFLKGTERCVEVKWYRGDGTYYTTWEFKYLFSSQYYLVESLWAE